MSFDLVVLSGAKPLTADQARDAYHHIASGGDWSKVLQKDDRVAQFATAFSARWPNTAEVDVSPALIALHMTWSAPDALIEFCESTAMGLGLNLLDPQDGTLYSPGHQPRKATPLPQKTLICEHCGKVIEPGTPHGEFPKLMHMECLFKTLGT
jgi:hypothetical protein